MFVGRGKRGGRARSNGERNEQKKTSSEGSAKTVSKAKSTAGMNRPSKSANLQCRGCLLWFRFDMMAVASSLCLACKNKVDNIWRIAKAQGKLDWINKIRSNDVQLQQVLVEYTRRGTDGRSTPRAVTMHFLETVVMTSRRLALPFLGLRFWALVFCPPPFWASPSWALFRFYGPPFFGPPRVGPFQIL